MIVGYELYQVATEYVTADLIIWKRYRQPCPGVVEAMLDANPHLAFVHRTTPFIPVGVYVRVPIDPDLLMGRRPPLPTDALWTDKFGYRV